MPKDSSNAILTTAAVARLTGVTPAAVRVWAKQGKLPHETTTTGQRLFRRADVNALIKQRARRK